MRCACPAAWADASFRYGSWRALRHRHAKSTALAIAARTRTLLRHSAPANGGREQQPESSDDGSHPSILARWPRAAQRGKSPRRSVFTERVAGILGAHPDPGPGDVDRAVRQALVGLWTPPAIEEFQRPPRWDRATPAFERVSKRAWLVAAPLWTQCGLMGGGYMS